MTPMFHHKSSHSPGEVHQLFKEELSEALSAPGGVTGPRCQRAAFLVNQKRFCSNKMRHFSFQISTAIHQCVYTRYSLIPLRHGRKMQDLKSLREIFFLKTSFFLHIMAILFSLSMGSKLKFTTIGGGTVNGMLASHPVTQGMIFVISKTYFSGNLMLQRFINGTDSICLTVA